MLWDGLWTFPLGLSQCHGHGSWLVCEVPLINRDLAVGIIHLLATGGREATMWTSLTLYFLGPHRTPPPKSVVTLL